MTNAAFAVHLQHLSVVATFMDKMEIKALNPHNLPSIIFIKVILTFVTLDHLFVFQRLVTREVPIEDRLCAGKSAEDETIGYNHDNEPS